MAAKGTPLKNKTLTPAQAKAFKAIMGCTYREMPKHAPTGLVTYHQEHRDKLYQACIDQRQDEAKFLKKLGLGHALFRNWNKKDPGRYPPINKHTLLATDEQKQKNARLKELTGVERTSERFTEAERTAIVTFINNSSLGMVTFCNQVGIAESAVRGWCHDLKPQPLPAEPEPEQTELPLAINGLDKITEEANPTEHPIGLPTVAVERPRRGPRMAQNRRSRTANGGDTGAVFFGPSALPEGVRRFAVTGIQEAIDMLSLLASGGIDGNVVIMIDER